MEVEIPLSYNLNIQNLDIRPLTIINNYILINNFILHFNENQIIYKISSNIKLEFLLDFLHNYKDNVIKNIYNYLIIKFLMQLKISIKKNSKCFSFRQYNNNIKIVNFREYLISSNNDIEKIGTCYIDFNYCLIINNYTINKTFICNIDKNCILSCLYKLIEQVYSKKIMKILK